MSLADDYTFEDDQAAGESVLPHRKIVTDSEMDITPMIDITFLLLIFFLVASKMAADSEVKLPPAKHGTAVTVKSSAVLTLTPGSADQVNVFLGNGAIDDSRVTTRDLAEQEAIIVEYVDRMLNDENKQQVIVKAEKSVKHREVARVMRAVGQTGEVKVYVAVLEES